MSVIESLKWRSAVKHFDPAKTVSREDLDTLIEAANLAPTSGGLQAFKVVVVSNAELKNQLAQHAYNQPQVADASHILVFAAETNLDGSTVDRFAERTAEVRGVEMDSLIGFKDSMKMYVESMDAETRLAWAKKQLYIALGTTMAAAGDLKIDSCPMEGFGAPQFDEILDLKSKDLTSVVILPIGYRSEKEVYDDALKVRKAKENFVVELN